jgi:hypothetical protein
VIAAQSGSTEEVPGPKRTVRELSDMMEGDGWVANEPTIGKEGCARNESRRTAKKCELLLDEESTSTRFEGDPKGNQGRIGGQMAKEAAAN